MRILRLRFQNLNSLAGEWSIDFGHPAFATDGIFAITGPTGAGKTTVLDALCLALHGRTPRLDRVNKGDNEIMSRHTGECFAEVEFSTLKGRYRAHWYQHRSRRRADGELQPPRRELSNMATGEVMETSISRVGQRIEEITGMDFERFTRSMLLAQGNFAAFLQAPPDQRAPILEQITGTSIYSEISIRVHDRRGEERRRGEELEQEIGGLPLLSPEEECACVTELEEREAEERAAGREVSARDAALAWLQALTRLRGELVALDEQERNLATEQAAFGPERERLRLAGFALALSARHVALAALRRQAVEAAQGIREQRDLLPASEAGAVAAALSMSEAEQLLWQARAGQTEGLGRIGTVRTLDQRIEQLAANHAQAETEHGVLETKTAKNEASRAQVEARLDRDRALLRDVEIFLADHQADAVLRAQLAAIEMTLAALGETASRVQGLHGETDQAVRCANQALERWQAAAQAGIAAERELAWARERRNTLLTGRAEVLGDRESEALRVDLRRREGRREGLARLLETLRDLEELVRQAEALETRCAESQARIGQLAEELAAGEARGRDLKEKRDLLRVQRDLARRVRDLETERGQMRDGQPCPLCGALAHPYADGNVPLPDEAETALNVVEAECGNHERALAGLRDESTRVGTTLELLARQMADNASVRRKALARRDECLAALADGAGIEPLSGPVAEHLAGLEVSLNRDRALLLEVERLEGELRELTAAIEGLAERAAQALRRRDMAEHERQSAEREAARLGGELRQAEAGFQTKLVRTREELAPYGATGLSLAGLFELPVALRRRCEQWQKRQAAKVEVEQRMAATTAERQGQDELGRILADERRNKEGILAGLRQGLRQLAEERSRLFGGKDTDAEEARLAADREAAEGRLHTARLDHAAKLRVLDGLHTRIIALEERLGAIGAELSPTEQAFAAHLSAQGFADEAASLAAALPEEEQARLRGRAEALDRRRVELDERRRDRAARLAEEEARALTEALPEELERERVELVERRRAAGQRIGALHERLAENARLRRFQGERITALEAQRRECARWETLHELIGSADGKKFRNFVQGLTFERMILHANQQLRAMSDRYLLVRDRNRPLELNVVDAYQAGEIRSAKNLSGGESFIVSLALALGLSDMASRKVRVDSLFLDEGFGTLDEEALETALATLAGLRREGKLIGVISHVVALRERIACQIQVSPRGSGRSAIRGPGCSGA